MKKQGDHQNKKLFIYLLKPLILLKEGHQDFLKLHIPLERCSSVDEKTEAPKRKFCLKWKNNM